MSTRFLEVAALALVLAGAAPAPRALACKVVTIDADVLDIRSPQRSLLSQIRIRGRNARERIVFAEVRGTDATIVTEDGSPATFEDIVVGDHIVVIGLACRCDETDCLFDVPFIVTADFINIDNSLAALGGDDLGPGIGSGRWKPGTPPATPECDDRLAVVPRRVRHRSAA